MKTTISASVDLDVGQKLKIKCMQLNVSVSKYLNKLLREQLLISEFNTVKCQFCGAVYTEKCDQCPMCKLREQKSKADQAHKQTIIDRRHRIVDLKDQIKAAETKLKKVDSPTLRKQLVSLKDELTALQSAKKTVANK